MTENQSHIASPDETPAVAATATKPAKSSPSLAIRLLRFIPTLLVLALLVGVAWWGHKTGWRFPKLSELRGNAAEKEDWCAEHNVPDSRCIACHPELAGGNPTDWCKEHGVPESKCTICHPEILTTGVAGDWCKEHGVPESACPACHPELIVQGTLGQLGDAIKVLPPKGNAPGPGAPVNIDLFTKPDMSLAQPLLSKPGKDPKACQTHARRVQFASVQSVQKAGLRFDAVTVKPVSPAIAFNAESDYDRTRYAQVATPVKGRFFRVFKQVGEQVTQGETLALVDSAEIGKLKGELLEALAAQDVRTKSLRRIKESTEKGFRTEVELQEAEASLKEAGIKLFNAQQALANLGITTSVEDLVDPALQSRIQFLGLPLAVIKTLDPAIKTANLIPVVAPLDGVIVERGVVPGEIVEESKSMFAIADTKRMWVLVDVPQGDLSRIRLGQDVTFQPDGARDSQSTGKVTWISTSVDDQTRTVKVRAEVDNSDGKLLAHTFGRANVVIRQTGHAIVVPNEAIQWEGCCHIAFVRLSDTVFQTRKLRIGARINGHTEVIVGVMPGEIVVTTGSHILKSEILKANLGAGCTDD